MSAFCSQNQQVCDIKKDKINCDGEKKTGKSEYVHKAKLQKEGIFFLLQLFARDILLMKKLEIEETMTS